MPNELFETNANPTTEEKKEESSSSIVNKTVEESNYLTTLKVELEAERDSKLKELETTMNSSESSTEEKNQAYEQIKAINERKGLEDTISSTLKKEFELETFVKIEEDKVLVVVDKKEHDVRLANQIMRKVQEEFTEPVSVSVKFS